MSIPQSETSLCTGISAPREHTKASLFGQMSSHRRMRRLILSRDAGSGRQSRPMRCRSAKHTRLLRKYLTGFGIFSYEKFPVGVKFNAFLRELWHQQCWFVFTDA